MHYSLCRFTQVENVACLFWIEMVFEIVLGILDTRFCFLLLLNSPSARCVPAANRVCKDTAIFTKSITFLKQILLYYFFILFFLPIVFG